MNELESYAEDKKEMGKEEDTKRPMEKPAKSVMKAIGKSILNPKKKKAPKVKNGPSSSNTKKQNRVDLVEKSKNADEQD